MRRGNQVVVKATLRLICGGGANGGLGASALPGAPEEGAVGGRGLAPPLPSWPGLCCGVGRVVAKGAALLLQRERCYYGGRVVATRGELF